MSPGSISPSYKLLPGWPNLPDDLILGNPTGLDFDGKGNLLIFNRADRHWRDSNVMPAEPIPLPTILKVEPETGKLLDSWGDHVFIMPHGLRVDASGNVWVTDVGLHQVFKFSPSGRLLMALGEAGVQGADTHHFAYPTDVAVCADGSFYVSDGYGNSRVARFSAQGKYLFAWGGKGSLPAQFRLPHAIELDDAGHVYVADRENRRIQVFSPVGQYIAQWRGDEFGKISWMTLDRVRPGWTAIDFTLSFVGDEEHYDSDILFFDAEGNYISKLGGGFGEGCWYHNIAVDKKGNLYVTDIKRNKVYKFIPSAAVQ